MNNTHISPRKNVFNSLQNKGISVEKQYLVIKDDNSISSPYIKGNVNGLDIIIEMDTVGIVPVQELIKPYKIKEIQETNEILDENLDGFAMVCEDGICVKTNTGTKVIGNVDATPEIIPVVKLTKIMNPDCDLKQSIKANSISLKLLEMENLQNELNSLSNYLITANQLFSEMKSNEIRLADQIIYYVNYLVNLKNYYEDLKKQRLLTQEEEQRCSLIEQGLEKKLQLIKELDSRLIELNESNYTLIELINKLNEIKKFVNTELQYVDKI